MGTKIKRGQKILFEQYGEKQKKQKFSKIQNVQYFGFSDFHKEKRKNSVKRPQHSTPNRFRRINRQFFDSNFVFKTEKNNGKYNIRHILFYSLKN